MSLINIHVGDLVADEIRPHEGSRVFPYLAVTRKDSLSKKRRYSLVPVTQIKILELEREDRLDVLRLDGNDDRTTQRCFKSVAMLVVPGSQQLQGLAVLHC